MSNHDLQQKPKILITDDDVSAFVLLSELAKTTADIECDHAKSGQQAIEMLSKENYFLIILDYMMPEMDGLTTAQRINETVESHPPIIFVTGTKDQQKIKKQSYQLGAVDYLTKPVSPEAFTSKIQTFYQLYQAQISLLSDLKDKHQQHESANKMLNYSGEGMIGFSKDLIINYVNIAASTLLTAEPEELLGKPLKSLIEGNKTEEQWWQSDLVLNFLEGQNVHVDSATFWRPGGGFFPVSYTLTAIIEDDELTGGVLAFQDITERMMIERQLKELSSKDQLTNLLNRNTFYDKLGKEIEKHHISQAPFSLFIIDIDNFKAINDNFGHIAGDELLEQFSYRLLEVFPPSCEVARLGGDEFAVLVRITKKDKLGTLAQQAVNALKRPYIAHNKEIYSSVSIGISLYPLNANDLTQLVSAADTAMYLAKQNGKDSYCFFDKATQQALNEKFTIAVNLRKANYDDEFSLVFQPKINLATNLMEGAEALVRWRSPTLGWVSPGLFIPIAESSGYINDITQWVIQQAIKHTKDWNEKSKQNIPVRVAINASPLDLKRGTFVKQVLDSIYLDRLNPTWLELEVTESAVMDDPETAINLLKNLKRHGIRVSVDDFGTGYSSLIYLKRLPVDYLKIDQTFVKDIGIDKSDEKIIKAITQLAHSLDLRVIAEGIESQQQLDYLKALGCDFGQGYYFSEPLNPDEFYQTYIAG